MDIACSNGPQTEFLIVDIPYNFQQPLTVALQNIKTFTIIKDINYCKKNNGHQKQSRQYNLLFYLT